MAEQGLEEGLESYNQLDNAATPVAAWSGWTISGTVATRKYVNLAFDNGATGTLQVYATDYNPVAEACIPSCGNLEESWLFRDFVQKEEWMTATLHTASTAGLALAALCMSSVASAQWYGGGGHRFRFP